MRYDFILTRQATIKKLPMLLQGNGARMTLFTPQAVYVRTKHLGEEFADSMKAQQSTHLKTMQFHY